MKAHTQTYPYEHLRRPSQHILKIDEVTIVAILLVVGDLPVYSD
jgi:hypothetical protein